MSRHVFVSLTNLLKSQIIHLILNYSFPLCRAPLLQGFVVTGGRAARLQLWFLSALMTKISCSASLNMKLTCSTYPLTQRESGTVAPCDTLLICHDAHGRGRLRMMIGNKSSINFWDTFKFLHHEDGMGTKAAKEPLFFNKMKHFFYCAWMSHKWRQCNITYEEDIFFGCKFGLESIIMKGLHLMCLSQWSDWKGRGERKIGELNERRGMEKEGVKGEIRM